MKWLSLQFDFLSWRNHAWWLLADGGIYIPQPNLCLQMETKMCLPATVSPQILRAAATNLCVTTRRRQGKYIYIFITFPARWTVKTFILLWFGCKTLLVPSLFAAPVQTKMLNMLKRISAEHQHVGPASADGGWKHQRLQTLLCLKPVEMTVLGKVG